ncbi:MAG: 4Fe-4S binding protein [Thermofilum sp.]|nr:4Fe-4S binding protein [Thermofilum sp.]
MSKLLSWKDLSAPIVAEAGNSVLYKTGGWRALKPVLDQSKCIRCLLCWFYCPEPAIKRREDDSVEIDYDYCKGCGICANECPVKAIAMVEEGVG